LSIDPSTGLVQGTPNQAGSYTVQFSAMDAQGATVHGYFHWTVNPGGGGGEVVAVGEVIASAANLALI
jgi:uncharacterized membrane protein